MPNAALAYRVLDQIEAHPEKWDQMWWFTRKDCGTASCFAGWALQLEGARLSNSTGILWADELPEPLRVRFFGRVTDELEQLYVPVAASNLLGIDYDTGTRLFHGDNELPDLRRLVTEIFGARPEPEATDA